MFKNSFISFIVSSLLECRLKRTMILCISSICVVVFPFIPNIIYLGPFILPLGNLAKSFLILLFKIVFILFHYF